MKTAQNFEMKIGEFVSVLVLSVAAITVFVGVWFGIYKLGSLVFPLFLE